MMCKKIDYKLEKKVREYLCYQKHCMNYTLKFRRTTKKMLFHASVYMVRLQVLICLVSPCLQRNINRFLLMRTGLSVVADPRNVLRAK